MLFTIFHFCLPESGDTQADNHFHAFVSSGNWVFSILGRKHRPISFNYGNLTRTLHSTRSLTLCACPCDRRGFYHLATGTLTRHDQPIIIIIHIMTFNTKTPEFLLIYSPRHFSGRVFVSLADGHIVVFRRQMRRLAGKNCPAAKTDAKLPQPRTSSPIPRISSSSQNQNQLSIGEELAEAVTSAGAWNLSEAVVIRCAPSARSPVKSMAIVPTALTLWAGNRNRVLVIDTTTFQRLYA